jgi:hypothetical protein
MRPTELFDTLKPVIPTGQPVFIWGPPGVGKSSIVGQVSRELAMSFCDLRAVLLDPVDLRGFPYFSDGVAKWARPEFLPSSGSGVLFLDELPQAAPMVQAALLQLVLDRKIGEYTLPDGWTIIAAGNRAEDRAGGHRIISALLNRFVHLDLEVSNDDWHAWAIGSGNISPVVRSFLKFRPGLLFQFDPTANARAFPTPRSWSFVSSILPSATDNTILSLAAGCVGEGPAAEFVAFNRIYRGLPDIDQLLANPGAAIVPTAPDVLYAVCGAVAERCKKADDKILGAAVKYAGKLQKEFGVLMMRDVLAANTRVSAIPEGAAWLRDNRNLILGN